MQNRSLGTDRRTAMQLIEAALQQRSVIITKTIIDTEGKERQVKDVEATSQAVQAQEQLNESFIDFVREHHSTEIEQVYNELYNSHVHKAFREPAFTHYPGASTDIQLRFHQFRAVERIKEQDTLLAHAVGSGKTYTMIGNDENPGLYFSSVDDIFTMIQDRKKLIEYEVTASFVEIYNETLRDLLSKKG